MTSLHHERFMRVALHLAERHVGQTWPNPSVGAVVVKNGQMIGQGITARGGRPHAETQALQQAGENARGASLYVTLEPCAHHGQTPPCCDAIIAAGITTVIVATRDPNPLVSGRGMDLLRQAGIHVVEKIGEREARLINRGFFSVIEKKRPFISLKIATSLDGKIATASGESKWITGERARQYGHLLRCHYDAIATGIGTVLADDPMLTCRLPGLGVRSPVRVVFDRHKRLPQQSNLATSANEVPLWMMDDPDVPSAVARLCEKGITRLLVEAGPELSTAFLKTGLVDRMYWFRAPLLIGGDGLSVFGGGFDAHLDNLTHWQQKESITLGNDRLDIYERMDPRLRGDDKICSPA